MDVIECLEGDIIGYEESNKDLLEDSERLHDANAKIIKLETEIKRLTDIQDIVEAAIKEAARSGQYISLYVFNICFCLL